MYKSIPRIYPILDAAVIPATARADFLRRLGRSLTAAGVVLLEYRNKTGSDSELLLDAAALREALPAGQGKLILDDRVDLGERGAFDGVHVDAGGISPRDARRLLGRGRGIGTFGGGDWLVAGVVGETAD